MVSFAGAKVVQFHVFTKLSSKGWTNPSKGWTLFRRDEYKIVILQQNSDNSGRIIAM